MEFINKMFWIECRKKSTNKPSMKNTYSEEMNNMQCRKKHKRENTKRQKIINEGKRM